MLLIKNKIKKDIHLPQDYINFLLNYNGCNFEEEYIKYIYSNSEIELLELSSLQHIIDWLNSPNKIDFEGYYLNSLINELILPYIGYEKWGGEEISIGIGNKNNGFIYRSKLYSAIEFEKIANSFTEFLNGLVLLEE